MRIVVLGTGALGCVFAARLARHAEVWMLGTWTEGVEAVRRDGIRLHTPGGLVHVEHVRAGSDPGAVAGADAALVLVKSYQTARAAAWAARVLSPEGVAVTLQNGLDNAAKLVTAVGEGRAGVGVTYNGATLLGPGEVRHTAEQPTYLGVAREAAGNGGPPAQRIRALVGLLGSAGFEAHTTPDIEGRLWGKAVANAAINPLTALWRLPNGALIETPARREMLAALAGEAAAVARSRGVELPFDDPAAYAASVCRATAANRSSMLQDVERGRPTEIESINGVIVAEGDRAGVPVPFNAIVLQLVRAL